MKFLLLNQTFHPDIMATAQYLSELAVALADRGHDVTVICSRRAYDQPEFCFPKSETWRGVKIRRIATTAFGKQAKWRRAADFASFIVCCCLRLVVTSRPDVVVALTSPPLISFLGAYFAWLRRAKFVYWVMDLNPDEAIAAGWLREGSSVARFLHALSRFSFRRAQKIIALDRFMRDRILAKGICDESEPAAKSARPRRVGAQRPQGTEESDMGVGPLPPAGVGSGGESKIVVIPPWSHDAAVRFDPAGREKFRTAHGFTDKFVVMYSGNHSPVHPLDTLLAAADRLKNHPGIVFCFVGGGSEWRKIKEGAAVNGQSADSFHPPPQPGGSGATLAHPTTLLRIGWGEGGGRPEGVCSGSGEGQGVRAMGEVSNPFSPNLNLNPDLNPPPPSGLQTPDSALDPSSSEPPPPSPSTLNPQPSTNILCLPYQPLEQLSASLSAADLHVVVMGDAMVGLVHPCKTYNILAVGAPVLYIGPERSHVTEILERVGNQERWGAAKHGEVKEVVAHIQRIRQTGLQRTGHEFDRLAAEFSEASCLPRLVTVLESKGMGARPDQSAI